MAVEKYAGVKTIANAFRNLGCLESHELQAIFKRQVKLKDDIHMKYKSHHMYDCVVRVAYISCCDRFMCSFQALWIQLSQL